MSLHKVETNSVTRPGLPLQTAVAVSCPVVETKIVTPSVVSDAPFQQQQAPTRPHSYLTDAYVVVIVVGVFAIVVGVVVGGGGKN